MVERFDSSAFDALQPPVQMKRITDPDTAPEVARLTHEYFAHVRRSLFMAATRFDMAFVVQPLFTTQFPYQSTPSLQLHDTELTTLRFNGLQTIAATWDERDDANMHVVSFLKFPIGGKMWRTLDTLASEGLLDAHYVPSGSSQG